jgi:CRISPR-associated protein Cmr6
MPVAAVPKYLQREIVGEGLALASPALRFGLLLPVWTLLEDQREEVEARAEKKSKEGMELASRLKRLPPRWAKSESGAREAWRKVALLSDSDRALLRALLARQEALASLVAPQRLLRLEAIATAPFTTGLGNEHPLENGFAFLNPYGLPYLAGSGAKGVVRQAARELASGAWGDTRGWDNNLCYEFPVPPEPDRQPVRLSMLDVLFGRETEEGDTEHLRGVLTFWDVVPEIAGNSLLVEIMTPHQSHYYQAKPEAGSQTPHDSGQPNPIAFLTVPPNSKFVFHVQCDVLSLRRIAPDLADKDHWKKLVSDAFEHAFRWLGFGAKTAVGYGAMKPAAVAEPISLPGGQEAIRRESDRKTEVCKGATLRFNPGQNSVYAMLGGKTTAPLRGEELEAFLEKLGAERAAQLKSKRSLANVDVEVQREGNLIRLVGVAQ